MSADPEAVLARARRLADLLDSSFRLPVVGYRVGLDGLVGLVPVVGEWVTALASLYLVYLGYRAGAPASTLVRMTLNVVVDFFVGSVPIVGDALDVVWKANERNVALLERHVEAAATDGA